jgi:hypothetical protein
MGFSGTVRRGVRLRPLLAPAGVAAAAVAAVGFVSVVDPNQAGHYPTCPFLALTGWYCPGCGTLRMLHALGHGRIHEAFGHNVLAFSLLPLLGYLWVRWTVRLARGRPRTTVADPRLVWLLVAVIGAFWVLRNIPAFHFLAP